MRSQLLLTVNIKHISHTGITISSVQNSKTTYQQQVLELSFLLLGTSATSIDVTPLSNLKS